jgi:hypothetical protein
VITIAYIKVEPVQVALVGLILLGDAVTPRDVIMATADRLPNRGGAGRRFGPSRSGAPARS